jgi:hypothetical protein
MRLQAGLGGLPHRWMNTGSRLPIHTRWRSGNGGIGNPKNWGDGWTKADMPTESFDEVRIYP